jgi:hypothetical protein
LRGEDAGHATGRRRIGQCKRWQHWHRQSAGLTHRTPTGDQSVGRDAVRWCGRATGRPIRSGRTRLRMRSRRRRRRSRRRDRPARPRWVRRTTLRPAPVRTGRMRPTWSWRRRYGRVRRTAQRPRRLTRGGARRIRARWVRSGCVRPRWVRVGWVRPVRLRIGVAPRVVWTRGVAMRIGRRCPATGRDRAARTPGPVSPTRCPRRHRAPRVRARRVGARRRHSGRHRRMRGRRGVRSRPAAVRCAGTLLRNRGAAGTGRERRLRAPPGVRPAGRATLVAVLIGLARRNPLPGHRRHAGPGRGGGAGALVTLLVTHAASPRP